MQWYMLLSYYLYLITVWLTIAMSVVSHCHFFTFAFSFLALFSTLTEVSPVNERHWMMLQTGQYAPAKILRYDAFFETGRSCWGVESSFLSWPKKISLGKLVEWIGFCFVSFVFACEWSLTTSIFAKNPPNENLVILSNMFALQKTCFFGYWILHAIHCSLLGRQDQSAFSTAFASSSFDDLHCTDDHNLRKRFMAVATSTLEATAKVQCLERC